MCFLVCDAKQLNMKPKVLLAHNTCRQGTMNELVFLFQTAFFRNMSFIDVLRSTYTSKRKICEGEIDIQVIHFSNNIHFSAVLS